MHDEFVSIRVRVSNRERVHWDPAYTHTLLNTKANNISVTGVCECASVYRSLLADDTLTQIPRTSHEQIYRSMRAAVHGHRTARTFAIIAQNINIFTRTCALRAAVCVCARVPFDVRVCACPQGRHNTQHSAGTPEMILFFWVNREIV